MQEKVRTKLKVVIIEECSVIEHKLKTVNEYKLITRGRKNILALGRLRDRLGAEKYHGLFHKVHVVSGEREAYGQEGN